MAPTDHLQMRHAIAHNARFALSERSHCLVLHGKDSLASLIKGYHAFTFAKKTCSKVWTTTDKSWLSQERGKVPGVE